MPNRGTKYTGVTSSGPKVKRYKTAGPGTLRAFDFKNPFTYPATITPATAIPSGTPLNDLPDLSVASPIGQATMSGASVQSANGGIVVGTGKLILLPNDFILPALDGLSGRYLIIVGLRFASLAAPGAGEQIAGQFTAGVSNWSLSRNSGNANVFGNIANRNITFTSGLLTNVMRLGMEFVKDATAGTIQVNGYLNGALVFTGTSGNGGAGTITGGIPQPATTPRLGGTAAGSWTTGGEANSVEIRNLTNDITTTAEIIAADWAAWGARFGS